MKFLIIRLSSIGDIVLTSPVVRCLKTQIRTAEIHFLVKKNFAETVNANTNINKVHFFDNNFENLITELRNEKFDYIIDLHHNLRTWKIKRKLKVKSFSFKKLNIQKWLKVNFKINILPKIHIVDRYFETLKFFEVKNDGKGLDYFISDEVNLPFAFQNGYVAWVVGAKHFTKQFPLEKTIAVCKQISQPIIFLGGKEDIEKTNQIISQLSRNNLIFNAVGKFSLSESASFLQQATCVVTPDTGLMHIAAAFKKKILSIWGNTIPELGMTPYFADEKSLILEVKNLRCRPCTKIGFEKCPKKHFRCMNEINENQIVAWINECFESQITENS